MKQEQQVAGSGAITPYRLSFPRPTPAAFKQVVQFKCTPLEKVLILTFLSYTIYYSPTCLAHIAFLFLWHRYFVVVVVA